MLRSDHRGLRNRDLKLMWVVGVEGENRDILALVNMFWPAKKSFPLSHLSEQSMKVCLRKVLRLQVQGSGHCLLMMLEGKGQLRSR